MKPLLLASVALLGLVSTPALAKGPVIEIENFVGRVTIDTKPAAKLDVTSVKSKRSNVDIQQDGTGLFINGGIPNPDNEGCEGYYSSYNISWFGKRSKGSSGGYKDLDDYADIVISAPADAVLVMRNAIPFVETTDLGGLDLDLEHCGRVSAGNISGPVTLRISGSSDVTTGDAGSVDAKLTGSGDLEMDAVDALSVTSTGSGDTQVGDTGAVIAVLRGSGDFEGEDINGDADFVTSGSGDVDVGDIRGGLVFRSSGSGDIEADSLDGPTEIRTSGSGDAYIRGGKASTLSVRTSGSGDVSFNGTAGDVTIRTGGSGDVSIERVTGDRDLSESGSGDIRISD